MREYQCAKCGRKQIIDRGKALWQILSEANEESGKD
jgi:DNA-directed RNA polymerase subunit RPC12/RpoP